jgi:hypothetical protein
MEPATVLDLDDPIARDQLGRFLRREAWEVSDLGDRQLLVRGGTGTPLGDDALRAAIERSGFMPRSGPGEDGAVLQESSTEQRAD